MCGIIGSFSAREDIIKEIFNQSQIRGKHATGISYVNDSIVTIKEPIPAKKFKLNFDITGEFLLIGHVRYSTSDLAYNQPLHNLDCSLVHNGVITQEEHEKWEEHFPYCNFETKNDSEILLKCVENNENPFEVFETASIAMCYLKEDALFFGRNGSRPLWYVETREGVFISSTEDILKRSLLKFNVDCSPTQCIPGTLYKLSKNGSISIEYETPLDDIQTLSTSVVENWYPKVKSVDIDIEMKDYRIPENRKEYLEKYFWWSLKTYDADPSLYMLNYIFKRMELNSEQRYWICWLYGVTYNLPTTWIIANEFPDFENVDVDRLRKWEKDNKQRLKYQTDTKFNKGFLSIMFESYKEAIGDRTQEEWFSEQLVDNSYDNFNVLFDSVCENFNRFGRYMTWFYLQTLKETCGLNVDTSSLLLEMQSAHTQRQAIAYAVGDDEIAEKKLKKEKLDAEKVKFYSSWSESFLSEFKEKYPELRADHFVFETTLCAWKKTFRNSKGRYLGYYLDRQFEDIKKAESMGWGGIDWSLLYQCRDEILLPQINRNTGVVKGECVEFFYTGTITNFEKIRNEPDLSNVLEEWI